MEKTIKASIIGLTKIKKELLDFDYNNYQWWMIFGIDNGLLSGFKSAKGYKQKVIKYRNYPLPLDSRFIKDWFRVKDTKLTTNWIKIPNSKKRGVGIWLPLKFHQEMPNNFKLNDSWLVKKGEKYYIHFCIDIPEILPYITKKMYSIDLGLRNPVTMVENESRETKFLGKEIKQIRGKYFHLRKKLGQNKNLKMIRKIKHKERNKINSIFHKISKEIVKMAYENNAAITIGKLEALPLDNGRKMNRKVSNFGYYKFTQYLKYKAQALGVPFYEVNEAYTSKTCSVCGAIGKRVKNWFTCMCGYKDNADRNAAFNIGKRGLSYMLGSGVVASAQELLVRKNEEASTIIRSVA